MLASLRGALGMDLVGDNQPYRMDGIDYTAPRHAIAAGLDYLELEVRQDLIADPTGEAGRELEPLVPDHLCAGAALQRSAPHHSWATQQPAAVNDPYLVGRVQPVDAHLVAQHGRSESGDSLDHAAHSAVTIEHPDLRRRDPVPLPLPADECRVDLLNRRPDHHRGADDEEL